jgi:hypothetical protein
MFHIKRAAWARVLGAAAGIAVATAGRAQTADQIIAKARAYLGGEAALNAIQSVHFVGTMETQEFTADGPKSAKFAIEIIFQKPYQQRITKTSATIVETTGLDDLEAWQRIQDVTNQTRWRLSLLAPELVKKLRANTWENLNFFKGIEQRGGRVEVLGPATVEGVATIKTAFIHGPGIVFTRYFDLTTGKLVLTETDQGGRIKEEGEIMVNGLRFPRKVTTTTKVTDARNQVIDNAVVVTFDRITLNETFSDSYFDVPALSPAAASPAPAAPALAR